MVSMSGGGGGSQCCTLQRRRAVLCARAPPAAVAAVRRRRIRARGTRARPPTAPRRAWIAFRSTSLQFGGPGDRAGPRACARSAAAAERDQAPDSRDIQGRRRQWASPNGPVRPRDQSRVNPHLLPATMRAGAGALPACSLCTGGREREGSTVWSGEQQQTPLHSNQGERQSRHIGAPVLVAQCAERTPIIQGPYCDTMGHERRPQRRARQQQPAASTRTHLVAVCIVAVWFMRAVLAK